MQFNSISYLLFLPIVFALYWLRGDVRWRNLVIVVASFVFYAWWDWRFLGLMVLTCGINFCMARMMQRNVARKMICASTLILNFAILGVFKYYDFFAESLASALASLGVAADFPLRT